MRPAIWTSFLYDLTPEEMVRAFSEKHWFELELSDEHAKILLERGDPEIVGKEFKDYAAQYGVSFPQGHLFLDSDIADENPEAVIEVLKKWLDLFYAVGVYAAVLHPGGDIRMMKSCSEKEIMDVRIQTLKALTEHIKGKELVLCLENCESGDILFSIIEQAGCSNVGICLDTGHMNIHGGDHGDFIRRAGSYLKALHIADNEGFSDQHMMPYGRGNVPWVKVVSALKEIKYNGLFNLELSGENRGPLPVRIAKLDYMKKLLAFMLEG